MADFGMITARLATGAAITDQADVTALIRAGVTHVLDCRAEFDDAQLLAGAGLTYLWDPTADDGLPKPDMWWSSGLTFATGAYSRLGTCVLAHCAAGVNRGPSMAYGVLRACMGFPPDAARQLVLAGRPQAGLAYAADFDRFWPGRTGSAGCLIPLP